MNNTEKALKFVIDAGTLCGLEDDRYLVTQTDDQKFYAGAIKVPGIDIKSYHDTDYIMATYAFGNAILLSELPGKMMFVGGRADYSDQMRWLGRKENEQADPVLKKILAHQRHAINSFGIANEERDAYVLFFSEDKQKIDKEIVRFSSHLTLTRIQPALCRRKELEVVMGMFLRGEISIVQFQRQDSKPV